MAVRFVSPQVQALDTSGNLAPGAKYRFYDDGTTTPRNVYSDSSLSTAYTQPIVADSAGILAPIYLPTGLYKVTIYSSADVLIATYDHMDPSLSTNAGALAVASGGTGSTTAAGARSALAVYSQAAGDALDTRVAATEALLTAPILAAVSAQTYAASFTPVFTSSQTRSVTLTGGITINAPTVTAGQRIRLVLIQDATGNRVATWNAAFAWPSGVAGTLSTTAAAVDVLEGYARTSGIIEVTSFKRQDVLSNIAVIEEQQAQNTAGGTFTSGADRTRVLNTEVTDLSGLVTVASNQILITNAGTYEIDWSAPAYRVDSHQSFLYNITSSAEVKRGTTEYTTGNVATTRSTGRTIVVLAATATFEIRHRCTTTRATDGLGLQANFGTEVYTRATVRKLT